MRTRAFAGFSMGIKKEETQFLLAVAGRTSATRDNLGRGHQQPAGILRRCVYPLLGLVANLDLAFALWE